MRNAVVSVVVQPRSEYLTTRPAANATAIAMMRHVRPSDRLPSTSGILHSVGPQEAETDLFTPASSSECLAEVLQAGVDAPRIHTYLAARSRTAALVAHAQESELVGPPPASHAGRPRAQAGVSSWTWISPWPSLSPGPARRCRSASSDWR